MTDSRNFSLCTSRSSKIEIIVYFNAIYLYYFIVIFFTQDQKSGIFKQGHNSITSTDTQSVWNLMQSMNRHSIGLPLAHVTLFGYSIYSFYGTDIRMAKFLSSSVTISLHTSTQHTAYSMAECSCLSPIYRQSS